MSKFFDQNCMVEIRMNARKEDLEHYSKLTKFPNRHIYYRNIFSFMDRIENLDYLYEMDKEARINLLGNINNCIHRYIYIDGIGIECKINIQVVGSIKILSENEFNIFFRGVLMVDFPNINNGYGSINLDDGYNLNIKKFYGVYKFDLMEYKKSKKEAENEIIKITNDELKEITSYSNDSESAYKVYEMMNIGNYTMDIEDFNYIFNLIKTKELENETI